jgi:hypothetical protein
MRPGASRESERPHFNRCGRFDFVTDLMTTDYFEPHSFEIGEPSCQLLRQRRLAIVTLPSQPWSPRPPLLSLVNDASHRSAFVDGKLVALSDDGHANAREFPDEIARSEFQHDCI